MLKPKGDWPENWPDTVHEFHGHGFGADPLDRRGEGILDAHVSSLYVQHGVEYASDDVSGADFDPKLVKAGRAVEMGLFKNMAVYDRVLRAGQKETRGKVIGTKWIDTNKGDIDNPKIRSRFVGKEFRTGLDDALSASTPHLEALRLIVRRAATAGPGRKRRSG